MLHGFRRDRANLFGLRVIEMTIRLILQSATQFCLLQPVGLSTPEPGAPGAEDRDYLRVHSLDEL